MKSERALEPGTATHPPAGREAAVPALSQNRLGAYRAALTHLRFQRDQIASVIEQLEALVNDTAEPSPISAPIVRVRRPVVTRTKASATKAAPKHSRPPVVVLEGQTGLRVKVLDYLTAHTDVSPKALREALFPKARPSDVKRLRDVLTLLEQEHLVTSEGATTTNRYRRVVKPNGKAAGDEFEVAWSGASKRPLTMEGV
jgi:hypothetical protein